MNYLLDFKVQEVQTYQDLVLMTRFLLPCELALHAAGVNLSDDISWHL